MMYNKRMRNFIVDCIIVGIGNFLKQAVGWRN